MDTLDGGSCNESSVDGVNISTSFGGSLGLLSVFVDSIDDDCSGRVCAIVAAPVGYWNW